MLRGIDVDLGEFRALVAKVKNQHPKWFALDSDPSARDEEIDQAERALDVTLPAEYRSFLKEFGGGYFALGNIFSVAADSDWNVVKKNKQKGLIGKGYVAISDAGTGDLYGFKCRNKACESAIWVYDHDSSEWRKTEFENLFAFLERKALSH